MSPVTNDDAACWPTAAQHAAALAHVGAAADDHGRPPATMER